MKFLPDSSQTISKTAQKRIVTAAKNGFMAAPYLILYEEFDSDSKGLNYDNAMIIVQDSLLAVRHRSLGIDQLHPVKFVESTPTRTVAILEDGSRVKLYRLDKGIYCFRLKWRPVQKESQLS